MDLSRDSTMATYRMFCFLSNTISLLISRIFALCGMKRSMYRSKETDSEHRGQKQPRVDSGSHSTGWDAGRVRSGPLQSAARYYVCKQPIVSCDLISAAAGLPEPGQAGSAPYFALCLHVHGMTITNHLLIPHALLCAQRSDLCAKLK